MSKLVVIRVGDQHGTWPVAKSKGMYSTPESQAQIVRNLFMQGHSVTVLFVGLNDTPLKLASVINVRSKCLHEDADPDLQTYMDLNPAESFDIDTANPAIFDKLRFSIKFKRGPQVIPDGCSATHVLAFFEGLKFQKVPTVFQVTSVNIPLNTTVNVGC